MKNTFENRGTGRDPTRLGLILCLTALPVVFGITGCSTTKQTAQTNTRTNEEYASMVGPRGADGPAGVAGTQGPVGATGSPGPGIAGTTGGQGPSGPIGVQGATGATGAAGDVARGSAGAIGPAGPAGAQGVRGETGAQGASEVGPIGAVGRTGPQGVPGGRGDTGAQGPTLVGPTGPEGRPGSAGVQGTPGETGARGSSTVGPTGATGIAGEGGPQGAIGATGAQGPAGVIGRWTSYRDFWFDNNSATLHASETNKVSEVADYMKKNPSLKAGIDNALARNGSDSRNQDLSDGRVNAVSEALVAAGVPKDRIEKGAFGNAKLARDGRVEVLLRTIE